MFVKYFLGEVEKFEASILIIQSIIKNFPSLVLIINKMRCFLGNCFPIIGTISTFLYLNDIVDKL